MKTSMAIRRLTAPQRRLLSAAALRPGGRLVGGDPRTRQILVDEHWVEPDGYHFGPLFRITELGRSMLGDPTSPGVAAAPEAATPTLTSVRP